MAGNFAIQARYRFFFRDLTLLLNADPELSWLATAAYGVTDAAVARPALELLENDAVHGALWTRELTSVGPVPWLAQLYVGGTVDAPWDTLDLFLPFLGVSDA